MDQGRLCGAREFHRRRFDAEAIELGNEPPLLVDGGSGGLIDRRRLSVQWFSGTILTGLCGAALMGGAVFASLDGETNFATAPERVEMALRGAISGLGERLSTFRKADRLPAISEASVTRQTLRVPTSTRVRDRELVRTRAFIRVSGNLSPTLSDLSANIPPFNPQKLLTDAVAGDDQTPAAEPDAEVSFVTCDLATAANAPRAKVTPAICDINSLLSKIKPSTLLSLDEVLTRVRDVANAAAANTPFLTTADVGASGLKMNYAAEGDSAADFGFVARVVPENVTLRAKNAGQTSGGTDWSERLITAKHGETVGSILRELGAAPDEIKSILAVFGPAAVDPAQGWPAAARLDGAGRHRPHAAAARHYNGRQRDPGRRRAVRYRKLRSGRHPQCRYRMSPMRPPTKPATTIPAARGFINRSTRPRCATTCRKR